MTYFTVGWFVGVFPFIFAANLAMPTEMQFALASEYNALHSVVMSDKCSVLKSEWYQAMESKQKYQDAGQPMPEWLLKRIVHLEAEMAEYC